MHWWEGTMKCRLYVVIGVVVLWCAQAAVWEQRQIESCTCIFRKSKREVSRQQQIDPLLIWIGSASNALQVSSAHGPVPLPSIWSSFVNVLYVSKCDTPPESFVDTFLTFYDSWLQQHSAYNNRHVFLMSNMLDKLGGSHVLDVAVAMQQQGVSLRSVILMNPPFTPTGIFLSHRSFESGNGMGDYSIQRVKEPIVCNAKFDEVSLVLHDAIFHYTPESTSSGEEMVEYILGSVSTYDTCYDSVDTFASDWLKRPLPSHGNIYAALASPAHQADQVIFPHCNEASRDNAHISAVDELLQNNITILSYKQIHHSSQLLCSFYISIYAADATSLTHHFNNHVTRQFDHATLSQMDFNSKHRNSIPLGFVQDSGDVSTTGGRFVWMQFDSRASMTSSNHDSEFYLTKPTAVDILQRLVHDQYGDISYVELFL